MKKLFNNQGAIGTEFSILLFLQVSLKTILMMSFFFFLTSCSEEVKVNPEPVITGFQPDIAGSEEPVHIDGTGFGTSGKIIFGDNILSSDSWTDTCVFFTIPLGYIDTEQKIGLRINGKEYIAGTISIRLRGIIRITFEFFEGGGCWSKDGKRIFITKWGDNYENDIYSIPWTGGEATLVKHIPGTENMLDVNIANGHFLFCKQPGGVNNPSKIYTASEDLTSIRRLYVTGENSDPEWEYFPTWNSTGGYPFYAWTVYDESIRGNRIFVANESQKEEIGEGYRPRFFPSNPGCVKLAYMVKKDDGSIAIVVKSFMGLDSDRDTLVSDKDIIIGSYDCSVTGRVAYTKKAPNGNETDIWEINEDGTNHVLISSETGGNDAVLRWSPDGNYLLFFRSGGGGLDGYLYVAYIP
jgi:hypothetical protein